MTFDSPTFINAIIQMNQQLKTDKNLCFFILGKPLPIQLTEITDYTNYKITYNDLNFEEESKTLSRPRTQGRRARPEG